MWLSWLLVFDTFMLNTLQFCSWIYVENVYICQGYVRRIMKYLVFFASPRHQNICFLFIVCSGGGAMDSGRSQTTYGMTSAISLAGPTPIDIRLSKTLEETLRSFDMFETDEQMTLRFAFELHWLVHERIAVFVLSFACVCPLFACNSAVCTWHHK